ncbi:hypothetical protein [Brevibacillus dissolubilis]|uniref:hypothetical protein n=1 Tax=Brevibacillus dissolubilis TaxID=1844116 RepID=UPI001117A843|nr:hypothetical protein [Brevibacillus dissolubilis]
MKHETLRAAALFAFSMLGPAYLSGFEWLRFFSYFGTWGSIGLIVAVAALVWMQLGLARIMAQHHLRSLRDLFGVLIGPLSASSMHLLYIILLLGMSGLIIAQEAVLLSQMTPLSITVSVCIVAPLVFLAAGQTWGRLGILAMGVLGLGSLYLLLQFFSQSHVPMPSLLYQMNAKWLWHALLFIALHGFLSLPVLVSIVSKTTDQALVPRGIVLGGAVFGVIALAVHFSILSHWHDVHNSNQPLMQILTQMFPFGTYTYGVTALLTGLLGVGLWHYGLAAPIVEEFELRQSAVLLVLMLGSLLFTAVVLWSPWLSMVIYSSLTYTGLALLGMFLLYLYRGRQKPSD